MPGIVADPLPSHTQAIREQISALPEAERRALMQAVNRDTSIRNDQRHAECAARADREVRRPRLDPRQLKLEMVA